MCFGDTKVSVKIPTTRDLMILEKSMSDPFTFQEKMSKLSSRPLLVVAVRVKEGGVYTNTSEYTYHKN